MKKEFKIDSVKITLYIYYNILSSKKLIEKYRYIKMYLFLMFGLTECSVGSSTQHEITK